MIQDFVEILAIVQAKELNKLFEHKIYLIVDKNKDISKQVELNAKKHCKIFGTEFVNVSKIQEFRN